MKGNNKMSGGFGNAMFAIKDVQNMYESFDKQPIEQKKTIQIKPKIQPPKVNLINKVPIKKIEEKPKIILKPTITNNSNTVKLIIKPKQQIKKVSNTITTKTQPPNKLQQKKCNSIKLNIIKVNNNTFQLTINKKATQWSYHQFAQEGLRADLIVPKPQISFNLNSRNIKQGSIGNCYFICSLAALTQNISVLKARILNYQKYDEKSDYFKVNMFESGKYVQINVKNIFQNNFSKSIQNDITCLIFQKAYAQLYGNYDIINMGHSIDALRDLSGNLAQYIDLKNQKKCFSQVIQAFKANNPMVIASKAKPKDESISGKHSYNVLSYSQKNNKVYLQLRDPRGWSKANFKIPSSLQIGNQNGQFWIGYEDLINNFEVITVSRYMNNSYYYYKSFGNKQISKESLGVVSFGVHQRGKFGFSIHQKHKKFFNENYQYNVINLMLCQVDSEGKILNTIASNFNSQQVCSTKIQLQKGKYAFVGQMYPFKNYSKLYFDQVFTISINSDVQITDFNVLQHFNLSEALTKYIQNHRDEFKALITNENLHRHHGTLFGKVCILYENHSGKQVNEELQFQTQNIAIDQTKVKLKIGQNKLITYHIGPLNNCSHKCVFKSKTYYLK